MQIPLAKVNVQRKEKMMQRPGKITLLYMSLYSEESTVFLNPFGLFKAMFWGAIQLEGKHAIMVRVHQNHIHMQDMHQTDQGSNLTSTIS